MTTTSTTSTPAATSARCIAGAMTGTSLDGLDIALVRVHGQGLAIRAELVRIISRPLGDLARPLRALAEQQPMSAGDITRLSLAFAAFHIDTLREVAGGERLDLICCHGQTVFHAPPASWQLLSPAPIARALDAPVVCDFRAADLAAGGQGAPITPLADFVLFRHAQHARAVINLGGFCNMTWLPPAPEGAPLDDAVEGIRGADVCACNHLLDGAARTRLGRAYDDRGEVASRGRADVRAVHAVVEAIRRADAAQRSLGTGDEARDALAPLAHLSDADALQSLCQAIAETISAGVAKLAGHAGCQPILAGGGVRNAALLSALRSRMPRACVSDDVGVPASHREAVCMAILGALAQDRVAITLPHVTGVREPAPQAGVWVYP